MFMFSEVEKLIQENNRLVHIEMKSICLEIMSEVENNILV